MYSFQYTVADEKPPIGLPRSSPIEHESLEIRTGWSRDGELLSEDAARDLYTGYFFEASCVSVNCSPAMMRIAFRAAPILGSTRMRTFASPD
jgi:hypothetical protein